MFSKMVSFLETYKTTRKNKSKGPIGIINNTCRFILWVFGIYATIFGLSFFVRHALYGSVTIEQAYHFDEYEQPNDYNNNNYCSDQNIYKNMNFTCDNHINEEIIVNARTKDSIDIITTLGSSEDNKIHILKGLNDFEFSLKLTVVSDDKYYVASNPLLTFTFNNGTECAGPYLDGNINNNESGSKYVTLRKLLKAANIVNLDDINPANIDKFPYRVTGITLSIYTTCSNLHIFDWSLKCTSKVYAELLSYTILNDKRNDAHFSDTSITGVRIKFMPINGAHGEITFVSLILCIVATAQFVSYSVYLIDYGLLFLLDTYTNWWNRRHSIGIYGGLFCDHINKMHCQLKEEFTTHDIDKHIDDHLYEGIEEIKEV